MKKFIKVSESTYVKIDELSLEKAKNMPIGATATWADGKTYKKVVRSMQKAVELEADDEFDEHQLAIGIQVELEHTEDVEEAMAIAMQHLKETPDYYTRLVESGLVDEEISSTGEIQEVLEKARITKYIKRIPKPSGKGYYYFYNRKQLKDYYEKGIAPGDKPKEEKGIIAAVLSFFGVKSEGDAKKKIAEKFEEHKDKFKGMDKKSFEDHVIEYLTNKEKWDKRISGQKGEAKGGEKKTDKKPTEEKGDKPKGTAGKKFNLSVMRQIAGIFGAPEKKTEEKKEEKKTGKASIKDVMKFEDKAFDATGAESGGEIREDIDKAKIYAKTVFDQMDKAGITKLTAADRDELEDKNYHLLNMVLAMGGYFGEAEQKKTIEFSNKMKAEGKEYYAFPVTAIGEKLFGESSKSDDNFETMLNVKTIDKKDYPKEFNSSRTSDPLIIKKKDIKDGFEIFGHRFFVAKNKSGEWTSFNPESAAFVGKGKTVEEARESALTILNENGKEKTDTAISAAIKQVESIRRGDKKEVVGLPKKEEKPTEEKKSETTSEGRKDPKSILGEAPDFDLKSAKKFYDEMIKQALEDDNSYRGPERGEISQEHHEHYDRVLKKRKEDTINYINNLTGKIKNKDRSLIETLHTGNKNSRNIFEEMTGVNLGSTEKSTEEALSKWLNIDIKAERDAAEKERKAKEAEDKKAQDAAKYAPLGSFGDNLSPKDKGRALEMLSKQYNLSGKVGSMKQHIERLIEDGWRINLSQVYGKSFESPTGSSYNVIDKSKILLSYADHVLNEKGIKGSVTDKEMAKEIEAVSKLYKKVDSLENQIYKRESRPQSYSEANKTREMYAELKELKRQHDEAKKTLEEKKKKLSKIDDNKPEVNPKDKKSSTSDLQKEYDTVKKEVDIVKDVLKEMDAKIDGETIIEEDGTRWNIDEFVDNFTLSDKESKAFLGYMKNTKRLAELKDDDALVGEKLFKARVQLEMALEKAKPTKYIKRIPKPGGKGWVYFYNEKQIKDFKEKGILPEDKTKGEKKDEPKKGFTDEQKHSIKDALKKVVSVLADALSAKDPVAPAAGAVEETGERIREKGLNDKKKREAAEMQKQAKKKADKGDK